MNTCDHPHTAMAVATEVGNSQDGTIALTVREIDTLSDEALQDKAPIVALYARVSAEHKRADKIPPLTPNSKLLNDEVKDQTSGSIRDVSFLYGTPSIPFGTGNPCQWIVVAEGRLLTSVIRNVSPTTPRSTGPVAVPLYVYAVADLPGAICHTVGAAINVNCRSVARAHSR